VSSKNASDAVTFNHEVMDKFLRTVREDHQPPAMDRLEAVSQLVLAFLQWNAGRDVADQAHMKLLDEVVDNNELRVSFPSDVVEIIGARYPKAQERAERLYDALNGIFRREHATSLDSLATQPKDLVVDYLQSLPGMTPYVVDSVRALSFDQQAIPVDDKLHHQLIKHGVVPEGSELEAVAAALAKVAPAGQAVEVHTALLAWSDATPVPPSARQRATGVNPEAARRYANRQKPRKAKKPAPANPGEMSGGDDSLETMDAPDDAVPTGSRNGT